MNIERECEARRLLVELLRSFFSRLIGAKVSKFWIDEMYWSLDACLQAWHGQNSDCALLTLPQFFIRQNLEDPNCLVVIPCNDTAVWISMALPEFFGP